jgi:ribosomal protein S27AE
MAREDTKLKTKQGVCPTHGTVEGTKEVPAFSPPGLFFLVKSVGNPLKPYECPRCGARVA